MAERSLAPIMIGITGKRDLAGRDAEVEAALSACFDLLDRELVASRKLFLTGLAAGADSIGARLALARGWKVVAVLPFALDLYAQDFDQAGAGELRALADPTRGRLVDPAVGEIVVLDSLIDPATNAHFKSDDLARSAGGSNSNRSDHYEQVGLFIAQRCALLIAVMRADERPGRVGGTARIVDYRLRGEPDSISGRIIRASGVLRQPVVLDSPQGGPVWLIDIAAPAPPPGRPLDLMRCWYPRSHAHDRTTEKITAQRDHDLVRPLRLAVRLDAFNKLSRDIGEATWQNEVAARARRDEQWKSEIEAHTRPPRANATSVLMQIRLALSVLQGSKKQGLTHTIALLALLFVFGVAAMEVHLQFEGNWPLYIYITLLILIPIVFIIARERALQQYSEDYRAVAEAARVQLAWWDAGLTAPEFCVDQMYLCGTHGSLALVRTVIRHLTDAARLENAPPAASPQDVDRWISGQVSYFKSRTGQRRASLSLFEDIVWFLFLASLGMAGVMLAQVTSIADAVMGFIDRLQPGLFGWIAPILAVGFVGILFAISRLLLHFAKTAHTPSHRLFWESLNAVAAVAAGISISVAMYSVLAPPYDLARALVSLGVMGADRACQSVQTACVHELAHKVIATATLVIASMAGAVRFYIERLAVDAELHSYREALATFQRAQAQLGGLAGDASEAARAQRDRILIELGKYALRENESWIRAHRVRPLEPHL